MSLEHLELDLRQKSDFGCEMNWSQSVTAAWCRHMQICGF